MAKPFTNILNLTPNAVVQNCILLDPATLGFLNCFPIHDRSHHSNKKVDGLISAGLVEALSHPWIYPDLVTSSPYHHESCPNGEVPSSMVATILTFLMNITSPSSPPERSSRLRMAVAQALEPLLMVMSDERHLFGGCRKSWHILRVPILQCVSNTMLCEPPKLPHVCHFFLSNPCLRKRMFRLIAYALFSNNTVMEQDQLVTNVLRNRADVNTTVVLLAELLEYVQTDQEKGNVNQGSVILSEFLSTEINCQYVRLKGLKNAVELNGCIGTLMNQGKMDEETQRYSIHVQQPEEKVVRVQSKNFDQIHTSFEEEDTEWMIEGEGGSDGDLLFGTIGTFWCQFIHQCVVHHATIQLKAWDSLEYVACHLYMLQGMGRGPYASCFAGTKASMRFLVDALAWCHTNGRLPSACLLHTLKMYMSNLTSGRRDKVVGYFVEQHGCLIMAELMMLGASKKYKKQHKKPNSPANQLKAECEEMIRVVSESCQGKYVRKLLMKEAQHHLIEEAKKCLQRSGKTTAHILSKDSYLKVFLETLMAIESQTMFSTRSAERKAVRKKHHTPESGGGMCGRCHKSCSKKLSCQRCKMLYCSVACQRTDWKQGPHKKICKERQQSFNFNVHADPDINRKIEKFHKSQSKAATDLIFNRMGDACLVAAAKGLTLPNLILGVDTQRGWISAFSMEDAIVYFELTGAHGEDHASTIAILQRNCQATSELASCLCIVQAHPLSDREASLICKSISANTLGSVLVQFESSVVDEIVPFTGMDRKEVLELVSMHGLSHVVQLVDEKRGVQ